MSSPVASWRQRLAYQVAAVHRVAMIGLFAAPLAVALRLVAEQHRGAALVAGGLMAAGFVGTLWLAPKLLAVSPRPARRGTAWRALLRLYRLFVGNGDAIQGLARWIDPGWQNPFTGGTPHETACTLASVEVIHWALLATSVPPIAAALWYGHYVLGFVCVAATVLFNLAPNLVMRDTRQRLLRLSSRTPAAATDTDRSGGDAAAPAPEVASAVGPEPGAEPGAAPDRGGVTAF